MGTLSGSGSWGKDPMRMRHFSDPWHENLTQMYSILGEEGIDLGGYDRVHDVMSGDGLALARVISSFSPETFPTLVGYDFEGTQYSDVLRHFEISSSFFPLDLNTDSGIQQLEDRISVKDPNSPSVCIHGLTYLSSEKQQELLRIFNDRPGVSLVICLTESGHGGFSMTKMIGLMFGLFQQSRRIGIGLQQLDEILMREGDEDLQNLQKFFDNDPDTVSQIMRRRAFIRGAKGVWDYFKTMMGAREQNKSQISSIPTVDFILDNFPNAEKHDLGDGVFLFIKKQNNE